MLLFLKSFLYLSKTKIQLKKMSWSIRQEHSGELQCFQTEGQSEAMSAALADQIKMRWCSWIFKKEQ